MSASQHNSTSSSASVVNFPSAERGSPSSQPTHHDGPRFDPGQVIAALRRRMYLAGAGFLIATAIVAIVTLRATPLYTSSGSVLIDPRETEVVDFQSVLSGLTPDSTVVDTEVKLIRSRNIAQRVIANLNLDQDPEFNTALRQRSWLGSVLSTIAAGFSDMSPTEANTSISDRQRIESEKILTEIDRKLGVRRDGLTYVISLSFESENPHKSARIVDEFASQYLQGQLEAKFNATERANQWLHKRLSALRTEVRKTEGLVEAYRTRSGLLSSQGSSLTEQQISDLNAQMIAQKARINEAEARLKSVRTRLQRGDDPETISEVLTSPVIGELRKQQAEVSRRYGELSSRYGPQHPAIIKIQRESADLQTAIDNEVTRIQANLKAEVEVERQRGSTLGNSLRSMRQTLANNNASMVRLRELERDANASRTLYENFLNRAKQTSENGLLNEPDARIVSAASIPTSKSHPKTLICLVLALLAGLFVACALVVIAEFVDRGLASSADVEAELDLPCIAQIMQLAPDKDGQPAASPIDCVIEQPTSRFAEAFRTIRSSIKLSNIDSPPKVLSVTSVAPGEGKTTISICLGRIAAMSGDRTVIVDCDLRRRTLSRTLFSDDREIGMLDVLADGAVLDTALVSDSRTKMDVLPLSSGAFTPHDTFGSEAFRALLHTLSQRYDTVVLDTAPLLAVAEVRTVAYLSDAVLIAARWRKTPSRAARTATGLLRDINARIAGVVLNRIDPSAQGRFESAGYGYYGEYAKYYTQK